MSNFEYKTICAPRKALKIKGVRAESDRYAQTLTDVINAQSADGWEYYRAESLPVDMKSGLMGKTSENYVSLLIFRRENIETYEEPALTASGPVEEDDPMVLQVPDIEDNIPAEISPVGPATR